MAAAGHGFGRPHSLVFLAVLFPELLLEHGWATHGESGPLQLFVSIAESPFLGLADVAWHGRLLTRKAVRDHHPFVAPLRQTRVAKAEEKTRSHAPPRWFPKALPGGPATTNALEKKKREATGSSRACDKAEQRFSNSPTTTPRSRREQICLVFILASRIPATTARLTTNTPFDKKVVHEALFSFYTHSQEEEEKRRK